MHRPPQSHGGVVQGAGDFKIRHRGKLQRQIFPGGAVLPDGSGGHDHVAPADLQVDAAAGPQTDQRVCPAFHKLLHGDGRTGPADARGADADLLAQQRPRIGGKLPVGRHEAGAVKISGDALAAARVAGQDHIPSDLALLQGRMHLLSFYKHGGSSSRKMA